jgi:hypothetical protein
MARELSIYCDESDSKGKHFENFYGGALVESMHLEEVITRLQNKKDELNLGAEVKWQKITEAYADKYIAFLDETFALLREGKLKMRVMFTQKYFGAANLTAEQRENQFFILYYHFVKYAFGLPYGGDGGRTPVRMYFDQLPDTKAKCDAFKDFVVGLNNQSAFREAGIVIKKDQIAEVDSKEHVILQSLDIVLGAMPFRLNDKHKEIPEGARRRGKRTVAKEKVFKHISSNIRLLYPGFNIGISTGIKGDIENRWHHPYRHWLFVPTDVEIREEYAKGK